ncbi:MAG: hypothetical protein KDE48_17250 [Anaerolineales bacterium]|nr:hypothetical protein [Anaerolineales bacterium]
MNIEQEDRGEMLSQNNTPKLVMKVPPSSKIEIDAALAALKAHKNVWASLAIQERINILDEIINDVQNVAERWINAGIEAQDLQANQYGIGEKHVMFS